MSNNVVIQRRIPISENESVEPKSTNDVNETVRSASVETTTTITNNTNFNIWNHSNDTTISSTSSEITSSMVSSSTTSSAFVWTPLRISGMILLLGTTLIYFVLLYLAKRSRKYHMIQKQRRVGNNNTVINTNKLCTDIVPYHHHNDTGSIKTKASYLPSTLIPSSSSSIQRPISQPRRTSSSSSINSVLIQQQGLVQQHEDHDLEMNHMEQTSNVVDIVPVVVVGYDVDKDYSVSISTNDNISLSTSIQPYDINNIDHASHCSDYNKNKDEHEIMIPTMIVTRNKTRSSKTNNNTCSNLYRIDSTIQDRTTNEHYVLGPHDEIDDNRNTITTTHCYDCDETIVSTRSNEHHHQQQQQIIQTTLSSIDDDEVLFYEQQIQFTNHAQRENLIYTPSFFPPFPSSLSSSLSLPERQATTITSSSRMDDIVRSENYSRQRNMIYHPRYNNDDNDDTCHSLYNITSVWVSNEDSLLYYDDHTI